MDNETSQKELGKKEVGEEVPEVLTVGQHIGSVCSEFA